jgi:tRNA(Glu) U13 pseudouridine synthase TruD
MELLPEEIPLVGGSTQMKGVIGEILEQDGIRPEYFGFHGTVRKSIFVPEEFEVLHVEEGLCRIRFILPKGSYATVLLRELNSTLSHN